MNNITDEFKYHAKELADLYHKRKFLAREIISKEERLKELGVILEFTDNLEKSNNTSQGH